MFLPALSATAHLQPAWGGVLMTLVMALLTPSRSVWWVLGAMLVGLALPPFTATVIACAAYYPIGCALAPLHILNGVGAIMLATVGLSLCALLGGVIYSLAAWSWRPMALSLILATAIVIGFFPGIVSYRYVKLHGYKLLEHRSTQVVDAIHEYERTHRIPPSSLADLVPELLPSIPRTDMAAYPHYEYETGSGPCQNDNRWHLKVDAAELFKWDLFYYCPQRNYRKRSDLQVIGHWAYYHE
jgi:hypothetical protein